MFVTGSPSAPPLHPFGSQSYFTGSLFAAIAILLALQERSRTGRGDHITISLQEAAVSTLDHVMVRYFYGGEIAKRQGSLSWNRSSFILPCKDGFIYLTLFPRWQTLVEWMASEGMAEDLTGKEYESETYRQENIQHIMDVMQRWTATHSSQELFEIGQALQFPWAPIYSPQRVMENPQLRARGFFKDVDHPELGTTLEYPGLPYRFGQAPSVPMKRAPSPGEDNLRIYRDELGLSEKEIERLSSMKII